MVYIILVATIHGGRGCGEPAGERQIKLFLARATSPVNLSASIANFGPAEKRRNLSTPELPPTYSMIGQLFTAAAPMARIACSTSTATLKTQITRQPTWQLTVRPYPSHLRLKLQANNHVIQKLAPPCRASTRLFSSTPAPSFTVSAAQQSSPFRLSSDKHGSSPAFEEDHYSQYKPKRQWPPDMSKLSPKHQFRLERKYRRRAALKYARPNFVKGVQLAQWGIIGCG